MSRMRDRQIASRHITAPKARIAATWPASAQPCHPKDAWRTSSTQWNSGLKCPATCAQVGRPSSGK